MNSASATQSTGSGVMSEAVLRAGTAPPAERLKGGISVSPRTLLSVALATGLGVAGAAYIAVPKATVSTDNAYLQADITMVAPRVHGFVSAVLVHDNQFVRVGDPLVRIDPEEFDSRVASAQADLSEARAGVAAARAALSRLESEERLAEASVHEAQTAILSVDAQSERASADQRRYERLVATGAVPQRAAEAATAMALSAQSESAHSRAALAVTRRQLEVTQSRRADLLAALARAEAAVAQKTAALDLARQDQAHALVRAPVAGAVGNRQANVGNYIQPGTRLLEIVPTQSIYLVANFKETQTARMLPGQPADIRVDALPGVHFTGRVESFAPGSGSSFALLPFEPGTGNFTKIVQRVPVRIQLDPGQPAVARLRPGLSATASVRVEAVPR